MFIEVEDQYINTDAVLNFACQDDENKYRVNFRGVEDAVAEIVRVSEEQFALLTGRMIAAAPEWFVIELFGEITRDTPVLEAAWKTPILAWCITQSMSYPVTLEGIYVGSGGIVTPQGTVVRPHVAEYPNILAFVQAQLQRLPEKPLSASTD